MRFFSNRSAIALKSVDVGHVPAASSRTCFTIAAMVLPCPVANPATAPWRALALTLKLSGFTTAARPDAGFASCYE
jgi:hypothetical protein